MVLHVARSELLKSWCDLGLCLVYTLHKQSQNCVICFWIDIETRKSVQYLGRWFTMFTSLLTAHRWQCRNCKGGAKGAEQTTRWPDLCRPTYWNSTCWTLIMLSSYRSIPALFGEANRHKRMLCLLLVILLLMKSRMTSLVHLVTVACRPEESCKQGWYVCEKKKHLGLTPTLSQ